MESEGNGYPNDGCIGQELLPLSIPMVPTFPLELLLLIFTTVALKIPFYGDCIYFRFCRTLARVGFFKEGVSILAIGLPWW